jgi:hypothetical protein
MTSPFTTTKGKLKDTVEKFHIYKETRNNNQINDKNTVKPNAIFDIIVRENSDRVHSTPSYTLPNQSVGLYKRTRTDQGSRLT